MERHYDLSWKRTFYCGEPRIDDIDKEIVFEVAAIWVESFL